MDTKCAMHMLHLGHQSVEFRVRDPKWLGTYPSYAGPSGYVSYFRCNWGSEVIPSGSPHYPEKMLAATRSIQGSSLMGGSCWRSTQSHLLGPDCVDWIERRRSLRWVES